jgi:hypothetical protein
MSEHPTERIDLRLPAPTVRRALREAARRGDDVRVLARRILTKWELRR